MMKSTGFILVLTINLAQVAFSATLTSTPSHAEHTVKVEDDLDGESMRLAVRELETEDDAKIEEGMNKKPSFGAGLLEKVKNAATTGWRRSFKATDAGLKRMKTGFDSVRRSPSVGQNGEKREVSPSAEEAKDGKAERMPFLQRTKSWYSSMLPGHLSQKVKAPPVPAAA